MNTIVLVLGWIVWAFVLIYSVGLILYRNDDKTLRFMMNINGIVSLAGCLITLSLPVSKFHLIWWSIVALIIPQLWMRLRFNSVAKQIEELKRESERTGIPFVDLVERENRRMESANRVNHAPDNSDGISDETFDEIQEEISGMLEEIAQHCADWDDIPENEEEFAERLTEEAGETIGQYSDTIFERTWQIVTVRVGEHCKNEIAEIHSRLAAPYAAAPWSMPQTLDLFTNDFVEKHGEEFRDEAMHVFALANQMIEQGESR
ncbi:MAG: hypothetical protein H7A48_04165 [Akkermansiaceae bacterium]|nr:hypothetical protein [Akkermansiaceae bacterium]MCP5547589.1 hypothetical protein [Akkermansiaceae bacterium]